MKASLKFREDRRPLMKAKVPISILGIPFLSGVSAGEPKDLRLDLVTALASGPSIRASYRPNDPSAPFAISLRTGVGCFGSPLGAPMSMTAEFTLGHRNTSFVVLFKPRLGDFSLKKVTSSARNMTSAECADESAVWVEKVNGQVNPPVWGVGDLVTGVEMTATSVLPVRNGTEVRFKWGVRLPAELRTALKAGDPHRAPPISLGSLPLLVMSKISVVQVAADSKSATKEDDVSKGTADVAEGWVEVRKQLEAIRAENGTLRKAVEELRGWGPLTVPPDVSCTATKKPVVPEGRRNVPEDSGRLSAKEEASEELRKVLMGAAAGSRKLST